MIRIKVNEVTREFAEPPKLMELRAMFKPDADLAIRNGFPVDDNIQIGDGDSIVLIRKGEQPSKEELEALLVARHSPGVHDRVKDAVVGIAGVGGLGSSVAVALARVGVGTLILADYDVVEPSNLNRQQFFVDQVGSRKVAAMEDNLRRINPFVRVVKHAVFLDCSNIPEVFRDADVVVEALDQAESKAELLDTVKRDLPGKPVVCASGLAGYGPSNTVVTNRFSEGCYVIGDGESEAAEGMGLMAPRVGIAAHHQANCVLRLLLGEEGE